MTVAKAINIGIDSKILERVDAVQPSHLTRKAFINELIHQGLKRIEIEEAPAK
jgi:hypothetical protein